MAKTRHCQSTVRLHNDRMGKTNRPLKGGPRRVGTVWTEYRDATRQPLYCLLLLLPLVGAYELGALLLRPRKHSYYCYDATLGCGHETELENCSIRIIGLVLADSEPLKSSILGEKMPALPRKRPLS